MNLERMNAEGFFSLQITLTGDGIAKGEFLLSNNNVNWVEPSGATDIFSGFEDDDGPGADGKDIFSFEPELSAHLRIKISETGTSNLIVVSAWIAIQ
jgi:hypothetical protein